MRSPLQLLLVAVTATAAVTLASGDTLADPASGDTGIPMSYAWFVTPLPNASYEGAPVTIDAEIGVYQEIEDLPIATIELFVNGMSIGIQDCPTGCIFTDIELAKGIHQLQATADIGYTTYVTVYVDEEVPSGGTDTGTDTDTDTGSGDTSGGESNDGEGGGEGGGGGGCSVQDGPAAPWALLTLPLLLLVPGFRKRAHDQ